MEIAFFLAMGWCGTKYPGWWKSFLKNPQPMPDPEPWWLVATISLGLMAGLSGGTLFRNAIMENHFFSGQTAIASGLFAFCTANVVTGIATAFKN